MVLVDGLNLFSDDYLTFFPAFVAMAAPSSEPLQKEPGIPAGQKKCLCDGVWLPLVQGYGIPRRKPLQVMWK
jgi:hypothetical protein